MSTRTIQGLVEVHEAIRHYVKEAKRSIDDLMLVSSQCSTEFNSQQCKIVDDGQFNLRQALQYLHAGLDDHQQQVSLVLRPLIGDALMKAVDKECREITRQFERVNTAIGDTAQTQLSPADLLVKTEQARQAVEIFSNLVESHSRKMDAVLQMLINATD